jgi:hypothetical protein
MTIQQTIEIPANRHIRLDFDVPVEIPTGAARFAFTITPADEPETESSGVLTADVNEDAFGMWKDRDISLSSIREKAWKRR